MARKLRFIGTDSKVDGCPALHTDEGTGEVIVQGTPVTDPEDLAQLRHLGAGEAAVAVPRELLVNWGPKERERVPEMVDRGVPSPLRDVPAHRLAAGDAGRLRLGPRGPGLPGVPGHGLGALRPERALVRQHQGPEPGGRDGRADARRGRKPMTAGRRFRHDYARHKATGGEGIRYCGAKSRTAGPPKSSGCFTRLWSCRCPSMTPTAS